MQQPTLCARFLAGLMVIAWVAAPAGAADELDELGLESESSIQPVDWEPVITRFLIVPLTEDTPDNRVAQEDPGRRRAEDDRATPPADELAPTLQIKTARALPSFRGAWNVLKGLVAWKPRGYGEQPVPSGFQIVNEVNADGQDTGSVAPQIHLAGAVPAGLEFVRAGEERPADRDAPAAANRLQTLLVGRPARVMLACDILMSDPEREKILEYFKLMEFELAGPLKVAELPADNGAAGEASQTALDEAIAAAQGAPLAEKFQPDAAFAEPLPTLASIGGDREVIGEPYLETAHTISRSPAQFTLREPGIYELKAKLRVMGRMRFEDADGPVKTVQAAVRFAVVDGGESVEIQLLSRTVKKDPSEEGAGRP